MPPPDNLDKNAALRSAAKDLFAWTALLAALALVVFLTALPVREDGRAADAKMVQSVAIAR